MKNAIISAICLISLHSADLSAEFSKDELKEYLLDQIFTLEDQLDDYTLDQNSSQCGYLVGLKTAYKDILYKISR